MHPGVTEHRGMVVSTFALCSEGTVFKLGPAGPLFWLRPFMVLCSPTKQMSR
jgi:hypothetical protein